MALLLWPITVRRGFGKFIRSTKFFAPKNAYPADYPSRLNPQEVLCKDSRLPWHHGALINHAGKRGVLIHYRPINRNEINPHKANTCRTTSMRVGRNTIDIRIGSPVWHEIAWGGGQRSAYNSGIQAGTKYSLGHLNFETKSTKSMEKRIPFVSADRLLMYHGI